MNTKERLDEIKNKLSQLQILAPTGRGIFSADNHHYRLNPLSSEDLIARFEELHEITLPSDYREFLLQVGNGGAGPYFGLWELAIVDEAVLKAAEDNGIIAINDYRHPLHDKVISFPFSSDPKYHSPAWKQENLQALEESGYADFNEEALIIGTQGCSISNLLIVTGIHRGEIWSVWLEEFFGFSGESLFEGDSEGALSFLDWYEHWLDVGLSQVENNAQPIPDA